MVKKRTVPIKKAVKILKNGGIVAFPTDTVYGLGADATNQKAVTKIYQIKSRDKNKPLIILVGRKSDAIKILTESPIVENVLKKFWPGTLTIIGKLKNNALSHLAKNNTLGVRMPNNKIFLSIARSCEFPIASTSANLSGEKPATTASDVARIMGDRINLIIDGGKADRIPSTIVDLTARSPKILRQGKITLKQIKKVLSNNY